MVNRVKPKDNKEMFTMYTLMTQRKSTTFRLDERLIEAIEKAAKLNNSSKNRYIEMIFIKHCQGLGILPMDFEPLGETRGGDHSQKSANDEV